MIQNRVMYTSEPTDNTPPVPEGKKEPELIRIKRASGRYEYVTPEELDILNKEKWDTKLKAEERKKRIRFFGMFTLTVALITFSNLYINSNDSPVSDAIQHPHVAIEGKKSIITGPDYSTKTEPDNITYAQLFAKQSPAAIAVTESVEPLTTVPADETTATTAENDHTDTAEVIDDKALIADTLNRWSDAWAHQHVEEYLLLYHDDFQPAQNMNKQSWIKDRWSKISRPVWIKIIITAMEIDLLAEDRARVIFKQQYESPNYRDAALKTIHLVKTGTHWKIIREESITI